MVRDRGRRGKSQCSNFPSFPFHSLIETQAKIASLHAKGGRSAQFRTRAERDSFLSQQVKELTDYIAQQNSRLSTTRSDLEEARTRLSQAEETSGEKRAALDGRKQIMDETAKEWGSKNEKKEELLERKKELWKEQARLNSASAFARDELSKARRAMASTMDKVSNEKQMRASSEGSTG